MRVTEKIKYVKVGMVKMIKDKHLTAKEIEHIAGEVQAKLQKVDEQLEKAEADGKPKLLAKLQALRKKEEGKLSKIKSMSPFVTKAVNGARVWKIRDELTRLDKLDKAGGSTVSQLTARNKLRDDLEPELDDLMVSNHSITSQFQSL